MSLISVSSSFIRAIGYEDGTLAIAFRRGDLRHYHGVPYAVFERFVNNGSKGWFYNAYIKGRYR